MSAIAAYARLVEDGCLCGTDQCADCPLHDAHDLRGLAAFFKAGMPSAFPMPAYCAICRAPGLLYPNIELDDPKRSGEDRPTLVCPRCSKPAAESHLVADAQQFGHQLNDNRVFA